MIKRNEETHLCRQDCMSVIGLGNSKYCTNFSSPQCFHMLAQLVTDVEKQEFHNGSYLFISGVMIPNVVLQRNQKVILAL